MSIDPERDEVDFAIRIYSYSFRHIFLAAGLRTRRSQR